MISSTRALLAASRLAAASLAGCGGCADPAAGPPDAGAPDADDAPDAGDVPPTRRELESPGSVTFNELHYHPPAGAGPEWLELHNPMAVAVDLSGWSLRRGVAFTFPEGTVVPAGGFVVVAADPSALAAAGVPGALGPFTGELGDDGDRVDLVSNGGRRIDSVTYRDDEPWPVAPDGTGATLAKRRLDDASDRAEHWGGSAAVGGTPGADNAADPMASPARVELVAQDATWRYDAGGAAAPPGWRVPEFDDGAWPAAPAPFSARAGGVERPATIRVTADNFHAVYLGDAAAGDLRLVGQDADGDWTTVDGFAASVRPTDHLYVAAWEDVGDGSPQMAIAEVAVADLVLGTSRATFEWVTGPPGATPGASPPAPPPDAAAVAQRVREANTAGAWAVPGVDAARSSDPWGWAVQASFDAATRFVWPDTFDGASVTDVESTYALFRSTAPVLAHGGGTELPSIPVTTRFRTAFSFDAEPARAALTATCELDDGAVLTLNGVEVLRVNLPPGPVDDATLATAEVTGLGAVAATLPAGALRRGVNVLAVELHQAQPADADLRMACQVTARVTPPPAASTLTLNELPAADGGPAWVELRGAADGDVALGGLVLASSQGGERVLADATLAAGALALVDDPGFVVEPGDLVALYDASRATLLDAVRVRDVARARDGLGGPWRVPSSSTPGADNQVDLQDAVVINEVMYHRAPLSSEGQPFAERDEEWVELHNRGDAAVDLGGWQLADGIAWTFPEGTELPPGGYLVVANHAAALRAAHPGVTVLGDFAGSLGNRGDRVVLLDAVGNPADEVAYVDGGRWPAAADGGGSSLELRDPRADNAAAEAWAASDERGRSAWTEIRYEGVALPSAVGPDGTWHELVLGLLDAGEVLIDDVSVVQDPGTAPVQLVRDGGFDADLDRWRALGTHRRASIVDDPDDPGNRVLHLVATGPTEHMHNHVETTLQQPIGARRYAISLRARWLSGNNQLNTRLYFNRLPRTTRLAQPAVSGTPGRPNTARVANLGPTFTGLRPDVAVPAPGEPVTIGVDAADLDGVATATLWTSIAGGGFAATPMARDDAGRWNAVIPGQPAGTVAQLFVEAADAAGATATFPARGPASRALVAWGDGGGPPPGLRGFRLVMTEADVAWLLDPPNLMSNDAVGATVVYDEARVFYDVGVRAKGSQRGRPESVRLGFGVGFRPDEPFRGHHRTVLLDRSEGVTYGQREFLLNLVAQRAGLVSAEYNDLAWAITPRPEHTGAVELQLDRFSGLVMDAQFEDGADAPQYDYELIYYPYTTDDGTPEGRKLPQPDAVLGTPLTDLGPDPEAYRWNFTQQSNLERDDFAPLLDLCRTFALPPGPFAEEVDAVLDVDQWLRAFAFATLAGAVDNYGGDGAQHNARLFVRPADGRALYFPHDLDFFGGPYNPVVGNGDLARLIEDPLRRRTYYQHLHDLATRASTTAYLGPWCDQLRALLPAQDVASHCGFIDTRAAYVLQEAWGSVYGTYPPRAFTITTNGGANFTTSSGSVELRGEGWIDVRGIRLDGASAPLAVTWVDDHTWSVTLSLAPGVHPVRLVATSLSGAEVGADSLEVTVTD